MNKRLINSILPLLVFALFAVTVMTVIIFGARSYRTQTERDDASFTARTAVQYVSTKIRQASNSRSITVEPFGDTVAIVLPAEYDGVEYTTKLYYYDGNLCELFSPSFIEMIPSDGEPVLPMDAMDCLLDDGLLTVTFTYADGSSANAVISLCEGVSE